MFQVFFDQLPDALITCTEVRLHLALQMSNRHHCRSGNIYKYPKGNYQAGVLLAMQCMASAADYCSIFGALPDTSRE